jgi:cyclic pyranopterin monophosphate synthase
MNNAYTIAVPLRLCVLLCNFGCTFLKILMKKKLSHVDAKGSPAMVSVSEKSVTKRIARAQATVYLGKEILSLISGEDIMTKKGPVFQTAILAGVMGAKQTFMLIPLCHPIGLEDCQVNITPLKETVIIDTIATVHAKTGVEMEALTAATIAALTIYDMCKAVSHDIRIVDVRLMEKTGGKRDFRRENK